ncbi:MAG: HEAT repeat domain-containing protein, partial [Methanoregulaceae archaeon]|nr:HEAT repeat domain-containing protein [Methanoregulaceae archaeon]
MNTRGSPEENTVQGYLEDIEKGPRKVRHEAIRGLAGIGSPAVPSLIGAMKDERNPDVLWYLALALARIGSPAIGP